MSHVQDAMIVIRDGGTSAQPSAEQRTGDSIDQLADIADAIVEAARASAFQVAETRGP